MATMPTFESGKLIGPEEWNAHATQINTNTTDVSGIKTTNTNQDGRLTTLETNQGTRGSNGTVYTEIGNLKTADTSLGNRVTALEALKLPGAYSGQWTDDNGGDNATGRQTIPASATTEQGTKITVFVNAVGTPTGCSMSGGTVTINQAGLWLITASTQYGAGSMVRALWISRGNAASGAGLAKYGAVAGPSMDVQTAVTTLRFTAGQQVSAYAAVWQGGGSVNMYRAQSNTITCTYLGP